MRRINAIIGCLSFLLLCGSSSAQPTSIYDSVMNAVRKEQVAGVTDFSSLNAGVSSYLNSSVFNAATGVWSDINYSTTVRTNPSWMTALNRVQDMALAYTIDNPGNNYYQNATLLSAINKALNYFCTRNPVPYSTNWYYQGVSRPQSLALILINMRYGKTRLDAAVEQNAANVMCKDTAYTDADRNNPLQSVNQGSNRTLIAMDWLYIGALIQSDYMLKIGAQESYSPIKYTTGEGIQQDLSYNMHYGYLYTGAYGTDFMSSVIQSASYTAGTRYAIKGSLLGLFRKFVLESVVGTIRGHWIDWNVIGRGISRTGTVSRNYASLLQTMQLIDADSASLYAPVIARMNGSQPPSYGIVPSHRHYWKTDYTLHLRPAYTFARHAISSRTLSTEIGNNENLKGFWAAEGATDIQTVGDEYYNIFPLWNWTRIPGTTLPDSLPPTDGGKAPGGGDRNGTSAFAGGVSDSLYGVTAFVMNNDVLTSAKKSWFQFDDEVVCLGAGISSSAPQPVNTTVNQALLRNNSVIVSSGGNISTLGNGVHLSYNNNLDWALQDGVGYVFPDGGNIDLLTENRQGNWLGISQAGSANSNNVENKNIFQLAIAHGVRPSNDKYAYIVVPGKNSASDMESYLAQNNISIGVNSDSVQAVYHRGLGIWQMVFYKGNAAYKNDSVKVWTNVPSTIMIEHAEGSKYKIYVADPSQIASSIFVFAELPGISGTRFVQVALHSGNFAGQSAVATISNNSDEYADPNDTTGTQTVTELNPIADTYVSNIATTTNYGTDTELIVKGDVSGYRRQAFLKFDLSGIDTAIKGAVANVQLKMVIRKINNTSTLNTWSWNLWHLKDDVNNWDSWGEGNGGSNAAFSYNEALNFQNTNGAGLVFNVITADASNNIANTGSIPFENGTVADWNSNANPFFLTTIKEELGSTGNKILSLMVYGAGENGKSDVSFYSREQAIGSAAMDSIPVLVITQIKRDAAVPVTLSKLKAIYDKNTKAVLLQWNTFSEINSNYFIIERSADGITYTSIGQVEAAGTSTVAHLYTYTDIAPLPGTNYYRIKEMDKDGNNIYSNVAIIYDKTDLAKGWLLYPNPVRNGRNITIELNELVSGKINIRVLDMSGRLCISRVFDGGNIFKLNTAALSRGMYLVQVLDEKGKAVGSVAKILIQ